MLSNILRVGGISAVIGGALLLVTDVLGWFANPSAQSLHGSIAESPHVLWWSVTSLMGSVLVLVGLSGLYARQAGVVGRLGLLGFFVAFAGTALSVGSAWAQTAPSIGTPLNSPSPGYTITLPIVLVGWTLFGVATLRAGVFPRSAAAFLVAGSMLAFLELAGLSTAVVLEAAIIWLGFSLLTEKGVSVKPPARLPRRDY